MSGPAVISAERLGKRYTIGNAVGGYSRLTEDIADALSRVLRRRADQRVERTAGELWALRDVSLEIAEGDVVGIVGRNGAGKTTLLKIMSRITDPTEGRAVITGRVGSLLEVGTGFHPELTGRENIYLNGAILGMRKREIDARFDEIVAFSEVERFLDTPVKRYSSGMHVRLAFAVAAHLEPEVLIVDEVLAVGDASFQRRCVGKMTEVAHSGRTVLFVSHNMGAVAELCTRAVLLDGGRVVVDGSVEDALESYSHLIVSTGHSRSFDIDPTLPIGIVGVELANGAGETTTTFDVAEEILIRVRYRVRQRLAGFQLTATLARNMVDIVHAFDTDELDEIPIRDPGVYEATYRIPPMFLKAGAYTVRIAAGTPAELLQSFDAALVFDIDELSVNTHSRSYRRDRPGQVISQGTWRTVEVVDEELVS